MAHGVLFLGAATVALAVGWAAPDGSVRAARAAPPAGEAVPPPPATWVTDRAGVLPPATVAELEARLAAYGAATGHQVLVYVDRTTGGVPLEDWTVRAFERWRVGRRKIDDGVVLFMFTDDRRVRIEVGYGLEGALPDARASRIIREQIVPRMRAGDADGAVRAGVESIIGAIGDGGGGVAPGRAKVPWFVVVLLGILFVGFVVFLLTHPVLAAMFLMQIGSGGHRGGGFGGWRGGGLGGGGGGFGGGGFGGGGGGFGGGGGRSGGGGASGSW